MAHGGDDVAAAGAELEADAAGADAEAAVFAGRGRGEGALGPVGDDVLRADLARHLGPGGDHLGGRDGQIQAPARLLDKRGQPLLAFFRRGLVGFTQAAHLRVEVDGGAGARAAHTAAAHAGRERRVDAGGGDARRLDAAGAHAVVGPPLLLTLLQNLATERRVADDVDGGLRGVQSARRLRGAGARLRPGRGVERLHGFFVVDPSGVSLLAVGDEHDVVVADGLGL